MNEKPPTALEQWKSLILANAEVFGIDPIVTASQVWTESSGNPGARRREPGFVWFFHPTQGPLHDSSLNAEENRRKALDLLGQEEFEFQTTSHGLLQIMGAIARELGYKGTEQQFYDPDMNLHYGCKKLAACLRQAKGDIRGALTRYNGSYLYGNLVLKRAEILRNIN